ncbi:cytosolic protein [Jeotgalibacillus salarius]|uniref:Cytosolic protein n=1 Tax=Jeotgalibacillus salarius TaxID=546023 RepID=A0A4Y8LF38_9BACL|nr:cytosolic protein [Jeotgalibacillus salarius]TFE00953.1 cytosolic protein [Jeotgalibacillus salarius]
MAKLKGIFKRFSQECETADRHQEKELETRYYKVSLDKVYEQVKQYFTGSEYEISSESRDHGEIMITRTKSPKMFLIATVVSTRPMHTAVDLKASTDQMVVGGAYPKLKEEILACYQALGREMREADK